MVAVTLWVLFTLVNGRGFGTEGYHTLEECQQEREVVVGESTTLMVSECLQITLVPLKGEDKK